MFPPAWPASLKFTLLTAGGFVATLIFPSLLARMRISRKHAPALGASAIVLSVFVLFAFIETRAEFPLEGVLAFIIGLAGFGVVLFADRVRGLL